MSELHVKTMREQDERLRGAVAPPGQHAGSPHYPPHRPAFRLSGLCYAFGVLGLWLHAIEILGITAKCGFAFEPPRLSPAVGYFLLNGVGFIVIGYFADGIGRQKADENFTDWTGKPPNYETFVG